MNKMDYLVNEATYLMNNVMLVMPGDIRKDWKNRREFISGKNKMVYVEEVYLYFIELVELGIEDLSCYYPEFKELRRGYMEQYDESLPMLPDFSMNYKSNN